MRVCFLNHDLKENTGAGRFGLQLVGAMVKENPDFFPTVLTTEGSGHPWERPLLSPNAPRLIFSFLRIRSVLKECDVIHALDGYPYGVIAAIASVGLGKKLAITAIGTGAIKPFRSPIKSMLLRWAYRRADQLVAISHYTKREIFKNVTGLDISIINHAITAEEFSCFSDEELSEDEKSKIEKLRPYILSVGGWKRRKGFEHSFPAFAKVARVFPKMKYVVIGAATPKLKLSEPYGITDRVFYFLGVRRQFLIALYRNAELFMLLPCDSRDDVEGFGFAFLEAAASGLPVIGTYESGAEDAVAHGKNGFLVEPRNSDAAARAALKILSDHDLREEFAKNSIDFARRMNWNKVALEYAAIYRKLIMK